MTYEGFTIEPVTEQTLDHDKLPVDEISYKVSVGDKLVAVGLPNEDVAKSVIDQRRAKRTRAGLDPVG